LRVVHSFPDIKAIWEYSLLVTFLENISNLNFFAGFVRITREEIEDD